MEEYASAVILKKYTIKYYHCSHCEFIQTQEPYWMEEAYNDSINLTDTGIVKRNTLLSKITSVILFFYFNKKAKFLDFAGGYGLFVRQMRDFGFDFYWKDKYTQNIMAKGFEYRGGEVELLTSFESFEHFDKPLDELDNMLQYSSNILFSTQLLPKSKPLPEEWWYFGLEHGQHISIYSYETLKYIANKYGLNLYSNKKNIHLFSKKKVNSLVFSWLVILSRFGFSCLPRFLMKSKTESDARQLGELS